MRILFVVPYTPNLIRVRPYNLIRALAGQGHEVTVLTLTANDTEEADARALAGHVHTVVARPLPRWRSLWNCTLALPTRTPLQAAYCWQPDLARDLLALANGKNGEGPFDVVHVEHLRGARYGLHLLQQGGSYPPIVWDSVDCITALFRQAMAQSKSRFGRFITRLDLARTEAYESWLLHQFEQVLVTSPADRAALQSLLPVGETAPITVLPNGVDLEYFRPGDAPREPDTLVISGKMSYHANVTMSLHLVEEIMPYVWASRPGTKLIVVGKDPPREIQALTQHPAITVTGTVPDIRPYLQQATAAVAPLTYGAGIQNKVLEAMACGTPVVTTPQTTAALQAVPDRDLLVADLPHDFAAAILELLDNSQKREAIGPAGLRYVRTHHNWDTIARRLAEVYRAAGDQRG